MKGFQIGLLLSVSSFVDRDFYSLVDVYLDAVFFPKCVKELQTFQQEGWNYDLNDFADNISLKGSFSVMLLNI